MCIYLFAYLPICSFYPSSAFGKALGKGFDQGGCAFADGGAHFLGRLAYALALVLGEQFVQFLRSQPVLKAGVVAGGALDFVGQPPPQMRCNESI